VKIILDKKLLSRFLFRLALPQKRLVTLKPKRGVTPRRKRRFLSSFSTERNMSSGKGRLLVTTKSVLSSEAGADDLVDAQKRLVALENNPQVQELRSRWQFPLSASAKSWRRRIVPAKDWPSP